MRARVPTPKAEVIMDMMVILGVILECARAALGHPLDGSIEWVFYGGGNRVS